MVGKQRPLETPANGKKDGEVIVYQLISYIKSIYDYTTCGWITANHNFYENVFSDTSIIVFTINFRVTYSIMSIWIHRGDLGVFSK